MPLLLRPDHAAGLELNLLFGIRRGVAEELTQR